MSLWVLALHSAPILSWTHRPANGWSGVFAMYLCFHLAFQARRITVYRQTTYLFIKQMSSKCSYNLNSALRSSFTSVNVEIADARE
jgi:hypothetical protein